MKRILICLISLLFCGVKANAVEIVYPKSNNVTINSESTFFIGNEKPEKELYINSEKVSIHPSGGFLHPVKLNAGENIFKVGDLEYRITRNENVDYESCVKEVLYNRSKAYQTAKDNVPIWATPYAHGLNRLQHLEKDIPLKVIGEFGDFYKIQLARDDYVWVLAGDIVKSDEVNSLAKIEGFIYNEEPDKRVFTIKLNRKVPYILSESSGLDLVVYNVSGYPEDKYEFHINKTGKLFGYKAYYKNNSELVIEVKNQPSVKGLEGLNITLDAGHGGSEIGAIGCLGDREKDVNLAITLKLKNILEQAGANVFLTREDDSNVALYDRVKFSQKNDSDIFISIHNNALPDSQAFSNRSGTSVFYFYPQSKELGGQILKQLVNVGMCDDKLRRESFAVIRNTESLALLIEVGYMIVPEDNAKITDEKFQQQAAEAIKQGLENYFNEL